MGQGERGQEGVTAGLGGEKEHDHLCHQCPYLLHHPPCSIHHPGLEGGEGQRVRRCVLQGVRVLMVVLESGQGW